MTKTSYSRMNLSLSKKNADKTKTHLSVVKRPCCYINNQFITLRVESIPDDGTITKII